MPNPPQAKKRIVVLGGGMSALSSVFALTNVPDWQDRYDITVYQMGWRLGGKCASGRNPHKHFRIEEHGLHVWGGFYENAFWMIKKVYAELGRAPGTPLSRWQDAFIGQDTFFLKDEGWDFWPFCLPTCKNSEPGFDDTREPTSIRDIVFVLLDGLQDHFEALLHDDLDPTPAVIAPGTSIFDQARMLLENLLQPLLNTLRDIIQGAIENVADVVFDSIAQVLRVIRGLVKQITLADGRFEAKINRHRWIVYDYLLTNLIGILADNLIVKSFDATIGDIEYGDWLDKHGVTRETWESPLLHAMYDLVFAFPDGEIGVNKRSADAASMLKVTLQIMRYRGSAIYRMAAGMGDAVVAPLYLVLKNRGVKFKFFHAVTNLRLSADRSHITAVEMRKQAKLIGEDAAPVEYQPLVDVNGLPCWLTEPLYGQIDNGDRMEELITAGQLNLEAHDSRWEGETAISLAAGTDYDEIIFGISVGAVPFVCAELIAADTRWAAMVQAVKAIPTQSLQLWLKPTLAALGWLKVPGDLTPLAGGGLFLRVADCDEDNNPDCAEKFTTQLPMVGGVYTQPTETLDTWVAMDQLIPLEDFPANTVGTVAYLTGVLKFPAVGNPPEIDHAAALATVQANIQKFLMSNAIELWGHGTAVIDPNDQAAWIIDQYVRSNTLPSELYVLSVAGSKKFRLSCQERHFGNLRIVGDWTGCGLDLGYVECAITSGLLGARALLKDDNLPGFQPRIVGGDDYYWLGNEG